MRLRWVSNANEMNTKKHEMYMANSRKFAFGTQRNLYSTDLRLGIALGNTNFRFRVGCFRVFRYQHGGIGNAKSLRWGCDPTQGPDASSFASQWNIGFSIPLLWGHVSDL